MLRQCCHHFIEGWAYCESKSNDMTVLSGMREYCERESFQASCEEGEVIMMQTAKFGRMRLGRCVQQDYGSLGCSKDVLSEMDHRCSGKRECTFPLTSLQDSTHMDCPKELMSYLEASYSCLKGRDIT